VPPILSFLCGRERGKNASGSGWARKEVSCAARKRKRGREKSVSTFSSYSPKTAGKESRNSPRRKGKKGIRAFHARSSRGEKRGTRPFYSILMLRKWREKLKAYTGGRRRERGQSVDFISLLWQYKKRGRKKKGGGGATKFYLYVDVRKRRGEMRKKKKRKRPRKGGHERLALRGKEVREKKGKKGDDVPFLTYCFEEGRKKASLPGGRRELLLFARTPCREGGGGGKKKSLFLTLHWREGDECSSRRSLLNSRSVSDPHGRREGEERKAKKPFSIFPSVRGEKKIPWQKAALTCVSCAS